MSASPSRRTISTATKGARNIVEERAMTATRPVTRPPIRVTTYAGPGAEPVMREVPWPDVPPKGALIQIGACGVCGTDQHILRGHWPKPLPWPFTLGHELAGVIVEIGAELTTDFMGKPIGIGSKLMLPPLMPCGFCDWCKHYPEQANKCLTPVYYGRYLGFEKPPHLWGGWAEYVFVDLGELPGTKIYKLPDDMSLLLGSLSEPLTSCIRAFNRAVKAGGFKWNDTVVIQGTGPIGILAIAAAQEMGAGRVVAVGAPETPRLALARAFGAEATVDIEQHTTAEARIKAVRDIVGGYGADLVMDCSGHPSAGPEGIEFLRDGGTYVEMGQFTDAGSIATSWHRICTKDLNVLGSWAFTANDLPLGVDMLYKARAKYPWRKMQTLFPFTVEGVKEAVAQAMAMKTVKSTIVPFEDLL
jgi:threonine dehydrogenase-like Zn-dependent dehydrogenase